MELLQLLTGLDGWEHVSTRKKPQLLKYELFLGLPKILAIPPVVTVSIFVHKSTSLSSRPALMGTLSLGFNLKGAARLLFKVCVRRRVAGRGSFNTALVFAGVGVIAELRFMNGSSFVYSFEERKPDSEFSRYLTHTK